MLFTFSCDAAGSQNTAPSLDQGSDGPWEAIRSRTRRARAQNTARSGTEHLSHGLSPARHRQSPHAPNTSTSTTVKRADVISALQGERDLTRPPRRSFCSCFSWLSPLEPWQAEPLCTTRGKRSHLPRLGAKTLHGRAAPCRDPANERHTFRITHIHAARPQAVPPRPPTNNNPHRPPLFISCRPPSTSLGTLRRATLWTALGMGVGKAGRHFKWGSPNRWPH